MKNKKDQTGFSFFFWLGLVMVASAVLLALVPFLTHFMGKI